MLDPILRLGPVMIPSDWLALLAGFFVATWVMRRDLDRIGMNGTQVVDIGWGAALIGVLVYRLGGAAANPGELLRDPIQTLMAVPGPYMKGIGFGAGWAYAVWKLFRAGIDTRAAWVRTVNAAAPGILLGVGLYQLAVPEIGRATALPWGIEIGQRSYHPIHLYQGVGFLLLGAVLRRKRVALESRAGWALLGSGVVVMMISFVRFPETAWLGLTAVQWAAFAASGTGLLILGRTQP